MRVKSIIKKLLKVIMWMIAGIFFIFIASIILIQIPGIQNRLINLATNYVSGKTNTRVEIGSIRIIFPGSVTLKNLFLDDLSGDTLVSAAKISVSMDLFKLISGGIKIRNFQLVDAYVNLKRSASDSAFNFGFLQKAFSDSSSVPDTNEDEKSPPEISISDINISNLRVSMTDSMAGMFMHISLPVLKIDIRKMDLDSSYFEIDKFRLEALKAEIQINSSEKTSESQTDSNGILPQIIAGDFSIENSEIRFNGSEFDIKNFELKRTDINLEQSYVNIEEVKLHNSSIRYISEADEVKPDTTESATQNDFRVYIRKIDLQENSVAYQSGSPIQNEYFDPSNPEFAGLTFLADNLVYTPEKSGIEIRNLKARDKNGFTILNFSGDFNMDNHSASARNMNLSTNNSSLDANLKLEFPSISSFKDSIGSVFINADIKQISIQNSEILYFKPDLRSMPFLADRNNVTTLSGTIEGMVSDISVKDLHIQTASETSLHSDFTVQGLPDIKKAFYSVPEFEFNSTAHDIKKLAGAYLPDSVDIPRKIKARINFEGSQHSFSSKLEILSSSGNAELIASLDNNQNYKANLTLNQFDIGEILMDTVTYGPVSLLAEIKGHGLDTNSVNATINASIPEIYYNQYTYRNLNADLKIHRKEIEGSVILDDKNIQMQINGLANLAYGKEDFDFTVNLNGVDFQKLNLTKDDLKLALKVEVDLQGNSAKNLNGKAGITNMIITKGEKTYLLDSLLFATVNEPGKSEINFSSAIVGMKYSGTISPMDISTELNNFINNYFLISGKKPEKDSVDNNFEFEIQLHNHPVLSEVFLPDLKEFQPGKITGSFDSRKNELDLKASVQSLVYGSTEIRDFNVDINSTPSAINYLISSVILTSSGLNLPNFLIEGNIANDNLFVGISSRTEKSDKEPSIGFNADLTKDADNYKLVFDPDQFYLGTKWNLPTENYIEFGKEGFLIHDFHLSDNSSEISIASVNDKLNDDIELNINNLQLEKISAVFEKDSSLVKGNLNGNVLLKRVGSTYGIIADAGINELFVQEIPIGNLKLTAKNPTAERFEVNLNLSGPSNNLKVSGFYIPDSTQSSVNLNTTINSLSLKTLEAFSLGQLSESSGTISGNFSLKGSAETPELSGNLRFNEAFTKPAFLNNRLGLKNESIELTKDEIRFNSFTLTDPNNRTAVLNGRIGMKNFSDFFLDIIIDANDFLVMNTSSKDNEDYYGRLRIDSKISVKGPLDLPVVNGRLVLKNGSFFTFAVPESKLTTDKGEGIIEFIDKLNPILRRTEKSFNSKMTGIDLSTILEIEKDAKLKLLIDPATSDSLVVKGEAALGFGIDRSGKISLTGNYELNEGSYLVSLENLVKRKFEIVQGSTIMWNGDPLDAAINIDAKYIVRTAPIDLLSDQIAEEEKDEYKQQFPFWLILKLRGEILKPVISFEIQLPPADKGILGGAVNQKLTMLNDDESALNKQVFALLVLGRFVQENPLQSEAGGGTSAIVRSTVSSLLSAQLNKLGSKIGPGTELDFDVQSYSENQTDDGKGRTQVEVGVKQQLFNERLTVQVGGNIDVEGERARQNSASDITGDVTVEYKITEDGRYRLKAFRLNQYEGAIEGQLVETGAGLMLVKDFDLWKDFLKSSKKKE